MKNECKDCKYYESMQQLTDVIGWCLNSDYIPQVGHSKVMYNASCNEWEKGEEE